MPTGEGRKTSMNKVPKMQGLPFFSNTALKVGKQRSLYSTPGPPGWSVEILVWENQIRIFSHNAEGLAHKLVEELKTYGLEPQEHFCSPCG